MPSSIEKPFAPACEENKAPILAVLEPLLRGAHELLEIGSGTGQHAVHFAAAMPWLRWQCSDVPARLPGITAWIDEADLPNLPRPLALDVDGDWPAGPFDAVFSANTAHIVSMTQVRAMFAGVGRSLRNGGLFALYGPFSTGGQHVSDSNREFDRWLRLRDPDSGVRDLDDLRAIAADADLTLVGNHPMPVNNQTLVWRRNG